MDIGGAAEPRIELRANVRETAVLDGVPDVVLSKVERSAGSTMLPCVSRATVGAGMTAGALWQTPTEAEGGDVSTKVFTNNVGYLPDGPKRAVVTAPGNAAPGEFRLLDAGSGATGYRERLIKAGKVKDRNDAEYWTAGFSPVRESGDYVVAAGNVRSVPFKIEAKVLERNPI